MICSHHIFDLLCKISPNFRQAFNDARNHFKDAPLDVDKFGTFSLNDILRIKGFSPNLFEE